MTPNIVVLCSWYDESPTWLAGMVASVAPIASHVVALDGAYALYPNAEARSPIEQAEAIAETATGAGMGVTVHQPREVWWGNEVEKRAALFEYGKLVARPHDDWFLVMDADELVTQYPVDLHNQLARTEHDVVIHTEWEEEDSARNAKVERFAATVVVPFRGQYRHRKLFRALPGLTVRENHFRYHDVRADGSFRRLWAEEGDQWPALEPGEEIPALRIRHRINRRSLHRGQMQSAYYKARDTLGVETSNIREPYYVAA